MKFYNKDFNLTISPLIVWCVFLMFTLTFNILEIKAQNPTFEQTATYIISNTKGRVMYPGALDSYSRVKGYVLKDIKIQKNGKIEFYTDQKFDDNNFSVGFNIFDLVEKVDYPDGIRAYKFLVHFNGLNVSSGYGITFATDADAQKIARALRYLKKVCVKENDLFSAVPLEEKKVQLTREETIDYINNLIYYNGEEIASTQTGGYKTSSERFGRKYCKISNKRLTYNSSTKKYTFGQNISYYRWDSNRDNGDDWAGLYYDRRTDEVSNINFKYFESIDFAVDKYSQGMDLPKLAVSFKSGVNNTAYFSIYLPYFGTAHLGESFEVSYEKIVNRLRKAFERLKELDAEDKDPFGD